MTPPGKSTPTPAQTGPEAAVGYELTPDDRIQSVTGAWVRFATRNGAGDALQPQAIVGRSIWEFISDGTTRELYRRLFGRVRAQGRSADIQLRCDAPDERRLLLMHVRPRPEGALAIEIDTVDRRGRTLRHVDPLAFAFGPVLRMCGWCNRVADPTGRWMELEDALLQLGLLERGALPPITHGICPECERAMTAFIDDFSAGGPGSVTLNVLEAGH
ncbi:MAG TPA: hypothetical protein VFS28_00810 [Gemmatimonadales bacterium]|nr:hypothetical protein [Gemmatimonadales bacterium]